MTQRTNLLVHWTGKDICKDEKALSDGERDAYCSRLLSILEKGFWMTTPPEKLIGGPTGGDFEITYTAPTTCFTETRISRAADHARRYGLLGVAVERRFILDHWGCPAHYVRGHRPELLVRNAHAILKYLGAQEGRDTKSGDVVAYEDKNPETWRAADAAAIG